MAAFADLCHAFLAEEYADSPVRATHLGIDGYDDRLDDLSEAAYAARNRRNADWLTRFEAVPDHLLGVARSRPRGPRSLATAAGRPRPRRT